MSVTTYEERHVPILPDEEVFDMTSLGEGYRLKSRKTVEFTPEFANNFLEYAEFSVGDEKVDRNLQENHVIYLMRQMLKGSFLWEQVNLATCVLEGREYRMNGQHTAWARIWADSEGFDKKARTPVQWLRYDAATVADMRLLYASIDRGKARNAGNVIVSHLAGSEEFPDYNKQILKFLAQGLGVWLWEDEKVRTLHGADDRAFLLLKDHHKTAVHVGDLIKASKPADFKHLKRAPVLGAMFATFNKAPHIAHEFWSVVRDGIGLGSKDDPRYVLRNYLMTSGLSVSHYANGDDKSRVVSSEEMYRVCLHLWNNQRAGKTLKIIKPAHLTERPEVK